MTARSLAAASLALAAACVRGPPPRPDVAPRVIQIFAQRFEYAPSVLHLRAGIPVVFELTATDHKHGFSLPQFGLRADIVPGEVARVSWPQPVAGTWEFHCDVFCGEGHENMTGELIVEP